MPTPSNEKYTARVPIIPDDINNRAQHKDNEVVTDIDDDIYIKRGNRYINITGQIRDTVKEIQDGSCVIHIVTEETLPPIKERKKNHWYYVVTKAESYGAEEEVDKSRYIYYGVIDESYYTDRNYILIAQNMFTNPSAVKLRVLEGYKACFYIPVSIDARFFNDETGEELQFAVQDRLYVLTPDNQTIAYDVYISVNENLGELYVKVDFEDTTAYNINIEPNIDNIEGFGLPVKSIKVSDGEVIGEVPDPHWENPRYIFKGWSSKKVDYVPVNPLTYVPDSDMTLYAYFEYDTDTSKYEYKSIYQSTSGIIIDTFYSVATPGTMIAAKQLDGYVSQTPSIELERNSQTFTFLYRPIYYKITYQLDGGIIVGQKTSYTIEDAYEPPTPTKEGYAFERWSPRRIDLGTIGDVAFTAYWSENGALPDGTTFRMNIMDCYPNIDTLCTAVKKSTLEPTANDNAINVSISSTPIYIWYSRAEYALKYYSAHGITCNQNMAGIFEGFSSLTDIASLSEWVIEPDANLSKIFKDCTSLADLTPIVGWENTGKNFSEAFKNTAAEAAGRLPDWYKWDCTQRYISSKSKKVLRTETRSVVPNSTIKTEPSTKIEYYTVAVKDVVITANDQVTEVTCTPISWTISYQLDSGSITGQKTTYDVEDVAEAVYTPPTPTKAGYSFAKWTPANLAVGSTGNKTFVASYSPVSYSLTYELNGGRLTGQKTSYTIEDVRSAVYTPPTPTKAGYDFKGWSPANVPINGTGNVKFVANWTPTVYNITYNIGPGKIPAGTSYPVSYTIESENVYPGFTLPNISSTTSFNGWSPAFIPKGSTGNKTFTALWKVIEVGCGSDSGPTECYGDCSDCNDCFDSPTICSGDCSDSPA